MSIRRGAPPRSPNRAAASPPTTRKWKRGSWSRRRKGFIESIALVRRHSGLAAVGPPGQSPSAGGASGIRERGRPRSAPAAPGKRNLVLVVDDPDEPDPAAPRTDWVHWLVVELPRVVEPVPCPRRAGDDGNLRKDA
ncbi:MAG: hypothetical protein WCH13_15960 [Deltaproteobacteria bacterium]